MKTKRVFLPRWQRWFLIPMFFGIWILITYSEFFGENSRDELGIVGYIIFSFIFLGMSVMFWLMTSGRLPAYLIEEKTREDNAFSKYNKSKKKRKEERKQKILIALKEKGEITNDGVQEVVGVSDSTATDYMQELENEGKVEQIGREGRSVRYRLKS